MRSRQQVESFLPVFVFGGTIIGAISPLTIGLCAGSRPKPQLERSKLHANIGTIGNREVGKTVAAAVVKHLMQAPTMGRIKAAWLTA